jgi:outer membrane lipoprotein SlyB
MTKFMTTSKTSLIGVLAALSLTACANGAANYVPIIDAPASPQLQSDLQSCQSLAAQRDILDDNTLTNALVGAGIGGLLALSGQYNGDTEDFLDGALIGGVVGGGSGVFQGRGDQKDIVIRCMAGRGYRVLG